MTEAAMETVWRANRLARFDFLPISYNLAVLAALMALVLADLSESQRKTLMNLTFQRDVELTALTEFDQSRVPRYTVPCHGELDQYEGHWVQDEYTGDEGFLDEHEDISWIYDEEQCFWMRNPFQGRYPKKGGKSKGKGKKGKSEGGKGSASHCSSAPTGKEDTRAKVWKG